MAQKIRSLAKNASSKTPIPKSHPSTIDLSHSRIHQLSITPRNLRQPHRRLARRLLKSQRRPTARGIAVEEGRGQLRAHDRALDGLEVAEARLVRANVALGDGARRVLEEDVLVGRVVGADGDVGAGGDGLVERRFGACVPWSARL